MSKSTVKAGSIAEQIKRSKYKNKGAITQYSHALKELIYSEEVDLPNRVRIIFDYGRNNAKKNGIGAFYTSDEKISQWGYKNGYNLKPRSVSEGYRDIKRDYPELLKLDCSSRKNGTHGHRLKIIADYETIMSFIQAKKSEFYGEIEINNNVSSQISAIACESKDEGTKINEHDEFLNVRLNASYDENGNVSSQIGSIPCGSKSEGVKIDKHEESLNVSGNVSSNVSCDVSSQRLKKDLSALEPQGFDVNENSEHKDLLYSSFINTKRLSNRLENDKHHFSHVDKFKNIQPEIVELVKATPYHEDEQIKIAKKIKNALKDTNSKITDETKFIIIGALRSAAEYIEKKQALKNPSKKYGYIYQCVKSAINGYLTKHEKVIDESGKVLGVVKHEHYYKAEKQLTLSDYLKAKNGDSNFNVFGEVPERELKILSDDEVTISVQPKKQPIRTELLPEWFEEMTKEQEQKDQLTTKAKAEKSKESIMAKIKESRATKEEQPKEDYLPVFKADAKPEETIRQNPLEEKIRFINRKIEARKVIKKPFDDLLNELNTLTGYQSVSESAQHA